MRPILALGAAASVALGLALAAAGGPSRGSAHTAAGATACLASILRDPFAPKGARPGLLSALLLALEDSKRRVRDMRFEQRREMLLPPVEHFQMGWSISDRSYWEAIPVGARRIPAGWSRLPVVRYTNSEVGGVREVRLLRGSEYDQWLLRDPEREIVACISVERSTKRAYFMEVKRGTDGSWDYGEPFDNCYSCHPSGPRVIRPLDERGVDRKTLERFNRLMLSYGACDFADIIDSRRRGEPNEDTRCAGCHDGVLRGRLYAIHSRPIRFKTTKEQTMPPSP